MTKEQILEEFEKFLFDGGLLEYGCTCKKCSKWRKKVLRKFSKALDKTQQATIEEIDIDLLLSLVRSMISELLASQAVGMKIPKKEIERVKKAEVVLDKLKKG